MSDTPQIHSCWTCGHRWVHGSSGHHDCGSVLRKRIIKQGSRCVENTTGLPPFEPLSTETAWDAILYEIKLGQEKHAKAQQELAELRRWKAEALTVLPDCQTIGREIGVTFGDSVTDKILPELIRRREEIEILRRELEQEKADYRSLAGHHNRHCTCLEIY